jgi:hypothetical protein
MIPVTNLCFILLLLFVLCFYVIMFIIISGCYNFLLSIYVIISLHFIISDTFAPPYIFQTLDTVLFPPHPSVQET